MYSIEDSNKVDLEYKKLKQEHLFKFGDLDLFFEKINNIILYYFNEQNHYKDINEFKIFLRKGIKKYLIYMNYKGNDYNELKRLKKELGNFDELYDKIIYYGEYNPIEANRQRLKKRIDELL